MTQPPATFRLTHKVNDGRAEAPPIEVCCWTIEELAQRLDEEFGGDYGGIPKVGESILIERVS